MPLNRPSQALSDKTNVNPSVNRQQEATAEDFNEAGALFNEYAAAIEALQNEDSVNPYYGKFTSLAVLEAAHTTALADGWVIIDAGTGATPQVASWDAVESAWEIAGATDQHVFVNSAAQLPATGLPQIDYITLDDMVVRVWYDNQYIIKSPQGENGERYVFGSGFQVSAILGPNGGFYVSLDNSAFDNADEVYQDIAELLANQGVQAQNGNYFVLDASDDPNVTARSVVYTLDTDPVTGDISDYTAQEQNGTVSGGGHTIQDEDVDLPQRSKLDFVGDGVTVTDDAANDKTTVTIPGTNINITTTSGWADYSDTQYNTGAPFSLTTAAGIIALPNNAGNVVDFEKPSDIAAFYDGSTIQGQQGDAYQISLEFKVRPTTNNANVRINTAINIGGAVGRIYPRDFSLTKGNGVEHLYLSSFLYYSLGTFEANGGIVEVQAINSNVEIYDVRYVIARTHKSGNEFVANNSITTDQYAAIFNSLGATAANPFLTKNDLTKDPRRRSVINIVDNTQAPPTEVNGDRYILDFTGASNAAWDGASSGDIVEFDGTDWTAETPEEGWTTYVDEQDNDYRFVDDGTPAWEVVSNSGSAAEPVNKTGTTFVFTEEAQYNIATPLTSGNITLDLTNAIKTTILAYFDAYQPEISIINGTGNEEFFITGGTFSTQNLNVLTIYYDGLDFNLNIGARNKLSTPNLTSTAGNGQTTSSWTSIINATSYTLQRDTDINFGSPTDVYTGGATGYTDNAVSNGTTYYYRVKAFGSGYINSEFSNTETVQPIGIPQMVMRTTSTSPSFQILAVTNPGTTLDWTVSGDAPPATFNDNRPIIDLSGNTGTAILTVTNIEAVTKIDARSENLIGDFDISGMDALDDLDISDNNLTGIIPPNNSVVRVLEIDTNDFTTLNLAPYGGSLEVLLISNTGLSTLDVSSNTGLTDINATDATLLTSINFGAITTIENLRIVNASGFTSLDVTPFVNLDFLYAYLNGITNALDISNTSSLTQLWVYGNSIPSITGLDNQTAITSVRVYENNMVAAETDQIYIDLDASGATNGDLRIRDNRTSASDTARANLVSKGWTFNETFTT